MTILGITGQTEAEADSAAQKQSSIRADLTKRVALGGGWSVGAASVFAAFEVLHANPHEAFSLLLSWGPKAIGLIFIVYVVYDLAKMALGTVSRLVHAVEKMAVAQQKSADKDDRQIQEIQTLTSYTAQQGERNYQMSLNLNDGQVEIQHKLDELLRVQTRAT